MKLKKLKLNAILFLGLGLQVLHAQEAVITTGGNTSGSGGTTSYSIGQVVYTANTGINGSVAQGIQQPFEISVVTAMDETKIISLNCKVSPNPATDYLTLKIENFNKENLHYQLYDINGKLLENKKMESSETRIFVKNFVSATYFLKVIRNNKEIKTFKIIKH